MNLDPDGVDFWTADLGTGQVYEINIASGTVVHSWNSSPNPAAAGVAVYGEISQAVCPQVTTNPQNDTTVCPSSTATFTAIASGSATVQWYQSTNGGSTWNIISGATSDTLTFAATTGENGYQYQAVFTPSDTLCHPVTSNPATLTVTTCCTSPSVTTNPSNDSVCRGSMGSFTAVASGNPAPTVQWMRSTNGGGTWTNISGATSTTYTTGAVTTSMNGYEYEAVFTNNCSPGTATTTAATLSVTTPPVLTSSPPEPAENVCEGNTASFSASASGTPTPMPQWQVSTDLGATWTNIPGANSTTLSLNSVVRGMTGYYYRSVFTNGCGSVTSRNGYLVVHYAPGTPTCPPNDSTRAGGSVLFNSTATGYLTPTVQWQVSTNGGGSWSNISGATANTLHLLNVTAGMNGYKYHAVFTNSCGTSTSCAATLYVH